MNKTKIISFTYTKDGGEISERTGITLGYSSPNLALIADISDTGDWQSFTELASELKDLKKKYLHDVSELLNAWEVQQKTFKLSGMTNIKDITKE